MGQAGLSLKAAHAHTSPGWQGMPPGENQKPSRRWVARRAGGGGMLPPSVHQLSTLLGDFLDEGDGLVSLNPQGTAADNFVV